MILYCFYIFVVVFVLLFEICEWKKKWKSFE